MNGANASEQNGVRQTAQVSWDIDGVTHSAAWWSANDRPAPKRIVAVDDRLTADRAVKYASQGVSMLWLGDFHNARQLLSAIDRRVTRSNTGAAGRKKRAADDASGADEFYRIRQARASRSRIMSMVLVPLERDDPSGEMRLPLSRAPEIGAVVAFGYREQTRSHDKLTGRRPAPANAAGDTRSVDTHAVVSLQELVGMQGAHQWYVKGVDVPSLGSAIHPHYGTFLPTRHEYVDLAAEAPIANTELAFDIGTGTGVLAAVLVKRGVQRVIGTDIHQRAVDCANENFARLGMRDRAEARLGNMFPEGRAQLIVCNPPWLPGSAATTLDAAIYDPGSQMLLQFLAGLPEHLTQDGEGWLIISDLAELLELRTREMLLDAIERAGLTVIDRLDTVPSHAKASDASDALHAARSREVTSLWRLRVAH